MPYIQIINKLESPHDKRQSIGRQFTGEDNPSEDNSPEKTIHRRRLILTSLVLPIALTIQQLPSLAGPITYLVEHKFETTSNFGVGPTHVDTMNIWSRCKRTSQPTGPADVYARVLGEVIFYNGSGQEVDQNGNILNNPSLRIRQEFPVGGEWGPVSGTPAVLTNSITWNTAQYLNGPAGVVKKIVRRYSLFSRGTANTLPSSNPVIKESEHFVN